MTNTSIRPKVKAIFLCFFILSMTVSLMGQSVNGGIKVGLNISKEKASLSGGSISSDALIGLHAGVYLKVMFSDKFGIQPELMYSQQGGGNDVDKERLNYFNLPVMARYQITNAFNLEVGPQVGFLLSAEDNDGNDLKDALNAINFGLAFGLGVQLPAGFNLSARYVAGLSNDVDLGGSGLSSSDIKLTQSNIMFSLGYKLFGQ